MTNSSKYIIISAYACILACIGEFVSIFALGTYYPGYNQFKDTMSSLGASISPVSDIISAWWVIMGLLMIFFGTGFYRSFSDKGIFAKLAALSIMLYGFGEGIGSGAFKADHTVNGLTISALVHDVLGGIGVFAILFLPLFLWKIIKRNEKPGFYLMSRVVFVLGFITILLFLFRFSSAGDNFLSLYKGLWQRLFMLNTYIYLVSISIVIIKNQLNSSKNSENE